MRKCSKCGIIKSLNEFHRDVYRKENRRYVCKECRKIISHKNKLSEERKRFDKNLNTSIYKSIKDNKEGRGWEKIVGYTLKDLKEHLECQFAPFMNWDNFGKYWWIDKIIPRSAYRYSNAKDEFKKCWSLKNLRPLEAEICRKKKDRVFLELVKEYFLFDILPIGLISFDKNYKKEYGMPRKPNLEYNIKLLVDKYKKKREIGDLYYNRTLRASSAWNRYEIIEDLIENMKLFYDYKENEEFNYIPFMERLKGK